MWAACPRLEQVTLVRQGSTLTVSPSPGLGLLLPTEAAARGMGVLCQHQVVGSREGALLITQKGRGLGIRKKDIYLSNTSITLIFRGHYILSSNSSPDKWTSWTPKLGTAYIWKITQGKKRQWLWEKVHDAICYLFSPWRTGVSFLWVFGLSNEVASLVDRPKPLPWGQSLTVSLIVGINERIYSSLF